VDCPAKKESTETSMIDHPVCTIKRETGRSSPLSDSTCRLFMNPVPGVSYISALCRADYSSFARLVMSPGSRRRLHYKSSELSSFRLPRYECRCL